MKKDIGSLPLPKGWKRSGSLPLLKGWKEERFSAGGRRFSAFAERLEGRAGVVKKGHRFSAFAERLEKEWFSAFAERLEGRAVLCRRKKVLCLCRKVGRKSGSLPEEEFVRASPPCCGGKRRDTSGPPEVCGLLKWITASEDEDWFCQVMVLPIVS
ncbi:hypothetical protein M5K25_013892 [Dendrobium thyrsiflorum]|uniref:Uncharacterized protein n=1 Tax=Dendrobium thyrsiflorum TaxID=117978 RepID=A0ABD0V106_DENTH